MSDSGAGMPAALILIVEDDEFFRHFLSITLADAGYRVREAADGRVALSVCLTERPDVVISDLIMPEVDGIELLEAVRRFDPPVPFVAMSAGGRMGSDVYLRLSEKLGAHAVLWKPFARNTLLETIASVLGAA